MCTSSLQGLLTPDGAIQCAYHGWQFDGDSGECIDIPQLQPGMSMSRAQMQSRRARLAAHAFTVHMMDMSQALGGRWLSPVVVRQLSPFRLLLRCCHIYCRCQVQQAHLRHSVPVHRVPGHRVAEAAAGQQQRRSEHSRASR